MGGNGTGRGVLKLTIFKCLVHYLLRKPQTPHDKAHSLYENTVEVSYDVMKGIDYFVPL